MLLTEELLCVARDDEELEEGRVITLEELRLVVTTLEELRLLVTAVDEVPVFTIPYGAGCAAQVVRLTQLLPFS